ncbi:MAG TPA: WXG100 family type VII secretion target [Nocardioides sp.]|nr:WXG100 family type VII secretion target [Nocardioides sp.]
MSNVEFGHAEGALKQIADRVIQAKEEFGQHSTTMESQLEGMRQAWVGSGGVSFQQLKSAWIEKHKVVVTALDRFHASLTETEADNKAVDEAAGSGMNTLLNRLGQQ